MIPLSELTIWPDDSPREPGDAGLWHVQFFWDKGEGPVCHQHGPVDIHFLWAVVDEIRLRIAVELLDEPFQKNLLTRRKDSGSLIS